MQKFLSTAAALFLCLAPAHAVVPNLSFTVNLNEPVIVDTAGGTPSISLDIGGITRLATYVSGSTTSSLTFTYTPQAGDIDLDGIQITPAQINPNGGTIRDVAGNAAILTFTAPDTSGIKLNYPSLSLDFIADADGRYTMNGASYDTLPAFLTATGGSFTRASVATYFDSTGILQTASADTPRFDYDMNTLSFKGLLIEESRTNSIPNSEMTGVIVGVLGSGGALPTGWNSSSSCGAGITREVVASGILANGMKYFDFRVHGTNASGAQCYPDLYFIPATSAAATTTQVWTGSVYASRIAGSDSNFGAPRYICTSEVNSVGTFLTASCVDVIDTTFARRTATRTFANASVVYARMYVSMPVPNGNTVDITLRVAAPQLERGAFATSYIPTTTTAVTRARDILAFPTSSWFSSTAGLLSTEAELNSDIASLHAFAALNGAGSYGAGRGFLVRSSSASQYAAGGNCCSAALNIGHATGTTLKVAGGYSGTTTVIASNNTSTTTTNNDFTGSGTTQLILGDLQTSSSWQSIGTGHISKFRYYPSLPATTQIQLLTQ